MMNKYFKILYAALCIVIIILLILTVAANKEQTDEKYNEKVYVVKSYKNTVALYIDDDIAEVYDNIVLNSLPQSDQNKLNKGICVKDENEAIRLIENYDG